MLHSSQAARRENYPADGTDACMYINIVCEVPVCGNMPDVKPDSGNQQPLPLLHVGELARNVNVWCVWSTCVWKPAVDQKCLEGCRESASLRLLSRCVSLLASLSLGLCLC